MIPVTGGEGVSVVVPQMISGRDPVTFSLRVRKEMGPCTLSVRQQGKAVFSKALPKALPAEMVVATVPPGVFAPVGDVEVMVSC
jgi:hypothetical protein